MFFHFLPCYVCSCNLSPSLKHWSSRHNHVAVAKCVFFLIISTFWLKKIYIFQFELFWQSRDKQRTNHSGWQLQHTQHLGFFLLFLSLLFVSTEFGVAVAAVSPVTSGWPHTMCTDVWPCKDREWPLRRCVDISTCCSTTPSNSASVTFRHFPHAAPSDFSAKRPNQVHVSPS